MNAGTLRVVRVAHESHPDREYYRSAQNDREIHPLVGHDVANWRARNLRPTGKPRFTRWLVDKRHAARERPRRLTLTLVLALPNQSGNRPAA